MIFKPKVNIGGFIEIKPNSAIQTSYGLRVTHIKSNRKYEVIDIEASIRLKDGSVKYNYLVSDKCSKGWLSEDNMYKVYESLESEALTD